MTTTINTEAAELATAIVDDELLDLVRKAYEEVGPTGDWASAVDEALRGAGLKPGPNPYQAGLDRPETVIATIADGRVVRAEDDGRWGVEVSS